MAAVSSPLSGGGGIAQEGFERCFVLRSVEGEGVEEGLEFISSGRRSGGLGGGGEHWPKVGYRV